MRARAASTAFARGLQAAALAAAACSAPRALGPVDPAFAPAFAELARAVDAGDDARARALLDGIEARGPEGDTLARAEGFARILEGRRLARALDLELSLRPVGENGRRHALELLARHDLEQALGVRSLPAMLSLLEVGVDARGLEQRRARSLTVEELESLELPPGRVTRVPLGEFTLDPGSALALRATFELSVPAGELVLDGRAFPANGLEVRPCSAVRLAEFLPTGPVEPNELLRCLRERCSTPALIERAVRIAPERRDETLELLSQAAPELTRLELEHAVPALRWLSGQRDLGLDAEAWRRWLAERAHAPRAPAGGLERAAAPAAGQAAGG